MNNRMLARNSEREAVELASMTTGIPVSISRLDGETIEIRTRTLRQKQYISFVAFGVYFGAPKDGIMGQRYTTWCGSAPKA